MNRFRIAYQRLKERLPSPERPLFKDHSPDAWYLKPATPGFQRTGWLIFAFIGLTIMFLEISQNGGIWAK